MYIIGIDEVGRGALAGPVVVAAIALPLKSNIKNFTPTPNFGAGVRISKIPLRDSKKLSPKQRETWFRYIKEKPFILYAVSRVYPKKIDSINISKAANLAATRAFSRLTKNSSLRRGYGGQAKLKNRSCRVFLDGGLFLPESLNSKFYILNSITKGDEKINAIKLASIVAKVTRDRYMVKLHEIYPNYRFNIHKGYGTKLHRLAIRKYGCSDAHRRSFRVK